MLEIIFRNTAAMKINRKFFHTEKGCGRCGTITRLLKVMQTSVNLRLGEKELVVLQANQGC